MREPDCTQYFYHTDAICVNNLNVAKNLNNNEDRREGERKVVTMKNIFLKA